MEIVALPPVRRIVTGVNADGRSYVMHDGPPPVIATLENRAGFQNANVYRTMGPDDSVDGPDTIADHKGVLPPPTGTVFRVIDIPPDPADPHERKRQSVGAFSALFPDAGHDPESARHPGMHMTDTVDYAIVLHGELYAVMDEDETLMRAGDVLVQRGTNHAWSNRSGEIARIAFILVDAKR
jgi:hypothetical protein